MLLEFIGKYACFIPLKDKKGITITNAFLKILTESNYRYMVSVSKNVYIDKLDDIVNKHNNTYHGTIRMNCCNIKL